MLETNKIGEVVIFFENIICGYNNNNATQIKTHSSGWFRTGYRDL